MESGFGSRLATLIEELGMKKIEFAEQIKVDQSYVTQLTNGKRKPSVRLVETICIKFNVNKYWLRYGTEPMFLDKSSDALDVFIHERNLTHTDRIFIEKFASLSVKERWQVLKFVLSVADALWEECYASVHNGEKPDTPGRAEIVSKLEEPEKTTFTVNWFFQPMSAGAGEEAGQERHEKLEIKKKPPKGTSFVARVKGNSMEPTYQDGDMVFVKAQPEVEIGEIGAFYMDGQMWIKERGDGVLISHNSEYDPRPMTDDVRCQGLVLGVCNDSYFE